VSGTYRSSRSLTWLPLYGKVSLDAGKQVKIAAIHSDFD
jgi:hypothetical protein